VAGKLPLSVGQQNLYIGAHVAEERGRNNQDLEGFVEKFVAFANVWAG
jgi:hypothetical protein